MAAVNVFAPVTQLEDRRQPTTTLEGWRRFVDADPPEFTLLSEAHWVALSADERTDYNEARVVIISGAAATGKTTAVKQLGRFHELRIRTRFGDKSRIPVVYVTAPPKGSPRKLAMEFARFLGLPMIQPRMNVTDIADAVCQVLIDARTDIVIDEISQSEPGNPRRRRPFRSFEVRHRHLSSARGCRSR